jgi:hypothetical protein
LCPLAYKITFEFGQGGQDVKREFARGRTGVDRLVAYDQINAECLKLAGHAHEVPNAAGESVELCNHDHVYVASSCCRKHRIERRPRILRAAYAMVDKFVNHLEAPSLGVITQRVKLSFRMLLLGTHSNV